MAHLPFNPSRMRRQAGFTLIEMAVVVVIIGILMAAGLKVAGVQRDAASYSATRTKQEAIKQALINYLRNNRRLPCPDSRVGWGNDGAAFAVGSEPDGIENRAVVTGATTQPDTTQNCEARFGVLPWATLGLPRDAALDGFGNFYTYHVKAAGAATPDNWNITANFTSGLLGNIIRLERITGVLQPVDFSVNPLPAAYIFSVVAIVSHGKNGLGARTVKGTLNAAPAGGTDEAENADGEADLNGDGVPDAVYIVRETNNDPASAGGATDDIVMTLTPNDLLGPLFQEKTLTPTNVALTETFTNIKDALVGATLANKAGATYNIPNVIPAGIPTTDPWGTAIALNLGQNDAGVTVSTITATSTTPTNVDTTEIATVFRLTSQGPDRVAGGGDDISYSITTDELRGILGKTGF